MFFVYLLLSKLDKRFYIGFTEDIEKRLKDHISGRVESTRQRRPLELIYYEAYLDKRDALGREEFLKSGAGHNFIKKQIKYYLENFRRGVEQPGSSQGS